MKACGRVLPSSFIHSKALQPPQTKLIIWSFHMYIPGNIQENEARMVRLSLCWIKSAVQTFCVTKTCCVVWNIQKQSLGSPVIQLQQLITQFTKEFNSKTDGKWRTSQYYEAKKRKWYHGHKSWHHISLLTKRSTLMHLKRIPSITKKTLQNFTTKMHINNTSICKQERRKDFG